MSIGALLLVGTVLLIPEGPIEQVSPVLEHCVDVDSLLAAIGELGKRWFEIIPEDAKNIWPVGLRRDSSCMRPDKPCLQYETDPSIRLKDGTPLCGAAFSWSATSESVVLYTVRFWTSTWDGAEATELARRIIVVLGVPEDAIASHWTEGKRLHQRYQWEIRNRGELLEVSVLSISTDRVGSIWRSDVDVMRQRIAPEQ